MDDGDRLDLVEVRTQIKNLNENQKGCRSHYDREVLRVDKELGAIREELKACTKDIESLSGILTHNRTSIRVTQGFGVFILMGVLGFNTVQLFDIRTSLRATETRMLAMEYKQSGNAEAVNTMREQHRDLYERIREIERDGRVSK